MMDSNLNLQGHIKASSSSWLFPLGSFWVPTSENKPLLLNFVYICPLLTSQGLQCNVTVVKPNLHGAHLQRPVCWWFYKNPNQNKTHQMNGVSVGKASVPSSNVFFVFFWWICHSSSLKTTGLFIYIWLRVTKSSKAKLSQYYWEVPWKSRGHARTQFELSLQDTPESRNDTVNALHK